MCGKADAFDQALVDFAVRTFGRIDVLFRWTTKGDEPWPTI